MGFHIPESLVLHSDKTANILIAFAELCAVLHSWAHAWEHKKSVKMNVMTFDALLLTINYASFFRFNMQV